MHVRPTVIALLVALLAGATAACGADATANQDCNTLQALSSACNLQLRGLSVDNCVQVLYFTPTRCQTALHTYLGCATSKACRQLTDGVTCLSEEQGLQIACQNGNATITVGQDGNTQTKPRDAWAAKPTNLR